MPNITTNHAITYTYTISKMLYGRLIFLLGILLPIRPSRRVLYSYFEKGYRENFAFDNPER